MKRNQKPAPAPPVPETKEVDILSSEGIANLMYMNYTPGSVILTFQELAQITNIIRTLATEVNRLRMPAKPPTPLIPEPKPAVEPLPPPKEFKRRKR